MFAHLERLAHAPRGAMPNSFFHPAKFFVHLRLSERHVTVWQTFHTQDYLKVMELFKVPIPDPAWKPDDGSIATIHGVWDNPPFTSFGFQGCGYLEASWHLRLQTPSNYTWRQSSLRQDIVAFDMSDMCY